MRAWGSLGGRDEAASDSNFGVGRVADGLAFRGGSAAGPILSGGMLFRSAGLSESGQRPRAGRRLFPAALRKRASKVTADGGPLHSFHSLLRDLATCTLNEMTTTLNDAYSFTVVATPTPIQAQAFSLLAVDPTKL